MPRSAAIAVGDLRMQSATRSPRCSPALFSNRGDLVGPCVELAVGQTLAIEHDRGPVRSLVCLGAHELLEQWSPSLHRLQREVERRERVLELFAVRRARRG